MTRPYFLILPAGFLKIPPREAAPGGQCGNRTQNQSHIFSSHTVKDPSQRCLASRRYGAAPRTRGRYHWAPAINCYVDLMDQRVGLCWGRGHKPSLPRGQVTKAPEDPGAQRGVSLLHPSWALSQGVSRRGVGGSLLLLFRKSYTSTAPFPRFSPSLHMVAHLSPQRRMLQTSSAPQMHIQQPKPPAPSILLNYLIHWHFIPTCSHITYRRMIHCGCSGSKR